MMNELLNSQKKLLSDKGDEEQQKEYLKDKVVITVYKKTCYRTIHTKIGWLIKSQSSLRT